MVPSAHCRYILNVCHLFQKSVIVTNRFMALKRGWGFSGCGYKQGCYFGSLKVAVASRMSLIYFLEI